MNDGSTVIERPESDDEGEEYEPEDDEVEERPSGKPRGGAMVGKSGFRLGHSCTLGFVVLIIYVLVLSDVFVERVMAPMGNQLVNNSLVTTRGVMAQGILIAMALIVMDFLLSGRYI